MKESCIEDICRRAAAAKAGTASLDTEQKNETLLACADALVRESGFILRANALDLQRAEEKGMHKGLVDRLALNAERIGQMAEGLRQVAALPDPIGEIVEETVRPNGLKIARVRVPLGVVGIIYEARPNVTADAFALCFKTGNVALLKGGSDAMESNKAITKVLRDVLAKRLTGRTAPEDALLLVETTDRESTAQLMKARGYVDVLIPRGSASLIRSVVENATVPVIETGAGNCHIFVDESADLDMALDIIENAKTQRIGVCNACESLLVHRAVADRFIPMLGIRLGPAAGTREVELRGDEAAMAAIEAYAAGISPENACAGQTAETPAAQISPENASAGQTAEASAAHSSRTGLARMVPAAEDDWGREYLDYILSVKVVDSVEEAIDHINRYNTKHSEAIITQNEENAQRFLREIDAACVYVNASTRFTDGFCFGLGAEIGISTQKLHARGPMGLKELTCCKYIVRGKGQIR